MTKSIIFCAVFPMLLDLFLNLRTFSPNLFALSPNLSRNFLAYHRRFSQNFCCLHRTFRPNFLRLQGTFRGYYLPCWLLLQQVFFRFRSSSDYRMWCRKRSLPFDIAVFSLQEVRQLLRKFSHFA